MQRNRVSERCDQGWDLCFLQARGSLGAVVAGAEAAAGEEEKNGKRMAACYFGSGRSILAVVEVGRRYSRNADNPEVKLASMGAALAHMWDE